MGVMGRKRREREKDREEGKKGREGRGREMGGRWRQSREHTTYTHMREGGRFLKDLSHMTVEAEGTKLVELVATI